MTTIAFTFSRKLGGVVTFVSRPQHVERTSSVPCGLIIAIVRHILLRVGSRYQSYSNGGRINDDIKSDKRVSNMVQGQGKFVCRAAREPPVKDWKQRAAE